MPPLNLADLLWAPVAWLLTFFVHEPHTGDDYLLRRPSDGMVFRGTLHRPCDAAHPWGEWWTTGESIVHPWPYGDWKRVP